MQHEIIRADALDWLRAAPDNSVDLIFGSPPYENCRNYGIGFDLKGQVWADWMVGITLESVRVSRGLVAFVVEGKTRNFRWSATPALLLADLHRAGVHLRKPPSFHRVGVPGSGGPDWLRNDYEIIVCATSGGKLPWSDNTAMGQPPKWAPGGAMSHRLSDGARVNQWGGYAKSGNNRRKNGQRQATARPSHVFATRKHTKRITRRRQGDDAREEQAYSPPAIANPGNVIKLNVGGGQMGSKLAHENEAPFPEKLAEFFIRSFCPPGGTVLDPFAGSGTVAAVAKKWGRNSISVDIRRSQVALIKRRLAEVDDA